MNNINYNWIIECTKTSNFLMTLTCVMINDNILKFSEIRCDNQKLNSEIIDFITYFGGIRKTYNFFADAYSIKNKHIINIYNYCQLLKIKPIRLRMSTNFTIIKVPIIYNFDESGKVA